MMKLQELLAQFQAGKVESVVCLARHPAALWIVGKVYKIVLDNLDREAIEDGGITYTNVSLAKFGVHQMSAEQVPEGTYQVNPHMKDGKLPTLVTGFNPNKVEVEPYLPERSYEELENLIRVGIDIQDAIATNAPDLDRALVDLWFELKGTKK